MTHRVGALPPRDRDGRRHDAGARARAWGPGATAPDSGTAPSACTAPNSGTAPNSVRKPDCRLDAKNDIFGGVRFWRQNGDLQKPARYMGKVPQTHTAGQVGSAPRAAGR